MDGQVSKGEEKDLVSYCVYWTIWKTRNRIAFEGVTLNTEMENDTHTQLMGVLKGTRSELPTNSPRIHQLVG